MSLAARADRDEALIDPGDAGFLRKLERLALLAKRLGHGGLRGERQTRHVGAGLEFADHRAYAPGDDLRRLDWSLFARLERPLVRLFVEEEDLPLYLLADTSGSMGIGTPPKLRLAIQVTAALAYVGLGALDRVSVCLGGAASSRELGPLRGKDQIHGVLTFLAQVRAAGETDLDTMVGRFLAQQRRRGMVVMLSDFFDRRGAERALDRLRHARFDPVVVQITAAEDRHAPEDGELVVVDVETGDERPMLVGPSERAAYESAMAKRLLGLQRHCASQGLHHFAVSAEQPFDEVVLRLFRAGGLLS